MATFVLVHGAWHGAWCWYKAISRLERAGHRVVAPDLPSLGRDRTPIGAVTLESWTRAVVDAVDGAGEPVVLVGHSRGGLLISEAAEARPGKIRTLVYVCAFLLRDGETLLATAEQDPESLILPSIVWAPDRSSSTLRESALREALYAECPEEDVTLARLLLGAEAVSPATTPLRVTEARFGAVPRVYVECLRDRTVSIGAQRRMQQALPCRRVVTLDTDHSPFLSRPDELTAALVSIAAES